MFGKRATEQQKGDLPEHISIKDGAKGHWFVCRRWTRQVGNVTYVCGLGNHCRTREAALREAQHHAARDAA